MITVEQPVRRRPATRRVVLIVLSVLLMALGALAAISGGTLMALFGSGNTVNSGVQQVSTTTAALVSPVAAIQNTSGVQTVVGSIRLRVTVASTEPGRQIFIGIGPAAQVDRYLSQVAHDVATDVTLSPFRLTLAHSAGTGSASPPGSQPFWVAKASGIRASLAWTVTDGSFRVVVMNADGNAPVRFSGQLALTVPHLFTIGIGLLAGGIVVLLAGLLLLLAAIRTRPSGAGPGSAIPSQVSSEAAPGPDSVR